MRRTSHKDCEHAFGSELRMAALQAQRETRQDEKTNADGWI